MRFISGYFPLFLESCLIFSYENLYRHSVHALGYQSSPLFFAKLSLNMDTVQAPLFRQFPLYISLLEPPPPFFHLKNFQILHFKSVNFFQILHFKNFHL